MTPDNDLDRAEWLNGPEPPDCVECGDQTTRLDEAGIPIHLSCEENRNERIYEERMASDLAGGVSAREQMDRAYDALRERRR